MSELKPCPFCGNEKPSKPKDTPYLNTVLCPGCFAEGPKGYSPRGAINAWNRRADGWVSVEERLPEMGGYVLVFAPWKSTRTLVWFDSVRQRFDTLLEVTYWRPLPEPPEQPWQSSPAVEPDSDDGEWVTGEEERR